VAGTTGTENWRGALKKPSSVLAMPSESEVFSTRFFAEIDEFKVQKARHAGFSIEAVVKREKKMR